MSPILSPVVPPKKLTIALPLVSPKQRLFVWLYEDVNWGGSVIINESINIAKHTYKSTDVQVPIIFGYKILGPISLFAGPTFKYNLSNSSNFNLEEIKDKYNLSILIGTRVKVRSFSLGLRYERGLNNNELLIINANGIDLDNANVDTTTNKLSLNISYDIPYDIFKKKD